MLARDIDICPDKLESLCKQIRRLYRRELPWYPLSVSTHRVLRHAPNMLRKLQRRFPTLTLAHLSEESGESSNMYLKDFQAVHSYQGDTVKRNLHTFHRLLERSDVEVHRHLDRRTKNAEHKGPEHYPAEILALAKDLEENEYEE